MTEWPRLPGNGRRVKWSGSIQQANAHAILWLPLAVAVLPLAVVGSLFSDRNDAERLVELKENGGNTAAHIAREANRAKWKLSASGIVAILIWMALGERASGFLFLGAFGLWVPIVIWVTPHKTLGTKRSLFYRYALVVLPVIPISICVAGYHSGREHFAVDRTFGTLLIRSADKEKSYSMKANVVRIFEKSVVVLSADRNVLLLRPEDIVQIEKRAQVSANKGVLCERWQIACPASKEHSPTAKQ